MSHQDFAALLQQTFADRKLSGGERDAVRAALAAADLSAADRAALRNRAFDLARAELTDAAAGPVLAWLADVVKVLWPPAERPSATWAEAYFSPGGECPERIARLFREARQRADVCVFTITDDRITDAVLDAHRRGVVVRVVTDNDKALDLGSDVGRLQSAGVPVRIDRTPFHMHHKFAIFDGTKLLNGSYNWTRGAARDNVENVVVTDEPRLVARFQAEFDRLWGALE
jgi:phosphatidylserine/phosphatidylglycerophosphate/cardiolipin synthase-like enzyme